MILGHSNKVYCKSLNEQLNKGSNYSNKNINEVNLSNLYKKNLKSLINLFLVTQDRKQI